MAEKISPYNEDNKNKNTENNFKDNSNIFTGVRYKPLIYLKKESPQDKKE